jgi:DNA-directed DNA polymerase III PolC
MNNENSKYLWHKCRDRRGELGLNGDEYKERFLREFNVIEKKGFVDYFLIASDIIEWAERNGIMVGPGRGSAGGCLVAYLSKITKIDPLKYDLLFERFLDPSRNELPDIDTDFQKSRRGEVFSYIEDKYGEDKVCHIANFVYFKPRSLIKDVCRVYNIPFNKTNKLTKLIPKDMETMEEAKKIKEVRAFLDKNPEIEDMCDNLEGCIKNKSKHAAGVLITPSKLSDYIGLVKVKGEICSCFDKRAIEDLGLLKLDILGLRTLDVIAEATKLIKDDIEMPETYEDPSCYEVFGTGKTLGLFQFETSLLTNMAREMKISNFDTLYAATTAVRPGARNSGSADRYIKRLLGEAGIEYAHDSLEEYLEPTLGEILFQEQIMRVANEIGKIELSKTYRMIKAISKSKGVDVINEYRNEFKNGCGDSGISVDVADNIFDIIQESGEYSFNKSHAVEYSALSYWTMWLKTYYPKEFLIAVIHYPKPEKTEKERMVTQAIRELRDYGHEVRPPSINYSLDSISIAENGNIYMGLSDVAGAGDAAVEEIIKNQPYESFDDFVGKVQKRKVNKKVLTNLIQSGAFDDFGRRDEFYYSFIDEDYQEWDDKEMLTRQLMVLDLPSKRPLIDYYDNKYEQYIEITPIADIDFSMQESEIWVRGIITDYKTRKATTDLDDALGIIKHMGFFDIDDGTKKVDCFLSPEAFTVFKDVIADGEAVIIKGHTWGKVDKIYVDGILSLTKENDETFENYAIDRRASDIKDIFNDGFNINTIRSATYRVSKNGNPYAEIYFNGMHEKCLSFNKDKDMLKVGEIVCWTSDTFPDPPFINIKKRIK